jgi:hypothetical protein
VEPNGHSGAHPPVASSLSRVGETRWQAGSSGVAASCTMTAAALLRSATRSGPYRGAFERKEGGGAGCQLGTKSIHVVY